MVRVVTYFPPYAFAMLERTESHVRSDHLSSLRNDDRRSRPRRRSTGPVPRVRQFYYCAAYRCAEIVPLKKQLALHFGELRFDFPKVFLGVVVCWHFGANISSGCCPGHGSSETNQMHQQHETTRPGNAQLRNSESLFSTSLCRRPKRQTAL